MTATTMPAMAPVGKLLPPLLPEGIWTGGGGGLEDGGGGCGESPSPTLLTSMPAGALPGLSTALRWL